MKFIFECDDAVLLPFTYDFSVELESFFEKTKIMDVRKNKDESLSVKENGIKNLKEVFRIVAKDFPTETSNLLSKLWLLEDGEKAPNAICTFTKMMSNKDFLDFFTALMSMAR